MGSFNQSNPGGQEALGLLLYLSLYFWLRLNILFIWFGSGGGSHMPWQERGGQRIACGSWVSLFPMWSKRKNYSYQPYLQESAFTYWAMSISPNVSTSGSFICRFSTLGWPWTLQVIVNDLELLIFLPPPPRARFAGMYHHTRFYIKKTFILKHFDSREWGQRH